MCYSALIWKYLLNYGANFSAKANMRNFFSKVDGSEEGKSLSCRALLALLSTLAHLITIVSQSAYHLHCSHELLFTCTIVCRVWRKFKI